MLKFDWDKDWDLDTEELESTLCLLFQLFCWIISLSIGILSSVMVFISNHFNRFSTNKYGSSELNSLKHIVLHKTQNFPKIRDSSYSHREMSVGILEDFWGKNVYMHFVLYCRIAAVTGCLHVMTLTSVFIRPFPFVKA